MAIMTDPISTEALPMNSAETMATLVQTQSSVEYRAATSDPHKTVVAADPGTIIVDGHTTAAQLQHLIDVSPAGTTLQLVAGRYTFDRTITIDRDDISVIGAGSGQTFIDVPPTLGKEAFIVGSGSKTGDYSLSADMAEGGKVMVLSGAHSLAAGDYVYLSRDSTAAFFDEIGDTTWRNTDVALRTSIVQVLAVNGTQITLASGVHFDFTKGETQVREITMAENVTLGGFTIDYGLSLANPSAFSNTLGSYDRNAVIEIKGTAALHLYDVTAHDVPSLGVNVAASTAVDATGLTMTGAHNKGDGGNGYGLQIRDVYDSRFTNISDADMRHSVVFASWCSAAGNVVHVTQTDRDINFHGGRDHDNVVMVDTSIRDANSDIISPTLFVNTEGTHYGTVTDAGANEIKFGHVVGSRLSDAIIGYDNGAWLDGRGGNDTLTGGAGNDLMEGGTGRDVLVGGSGADIAAFEGNRAAFRITDKGNGTVEVQDIVGSQSTDTVSEIEWLLFDDGALRLSDMRFMGTSAVTGVFAGPGTYSTADSGVALVGTAAKDVFDVTVAGTTVQGLGEWDVVRATVSFTMSDDVERLDLLGTASIDGTGGATANHIHGNDAGNLIDGRADNDRLWGQAGNDTLLGGEGADLLYGDSGDDRLDGGAGQDKLAGGSGADVFVFASAADTARTKSDKLVDFQPGVDRIDLSAIDANTLVTGNQAFVWRSADVGPASLWVKDGYLYGDIDANGIADLAIYLGGAAVAQTDIMF